MKSTGNTIFMTGGTSGIGLALARRFRDLGNTVIISGRRKDLLDRIVTEDGIEGIPLDVADPASITAAYETVTTQYPDLNVLVTMAGVMYPENLQDPDLSTVEQIIDINLLGTIRTVSAFTPHLLKQADGVIMTVSSGLAFVPLVMTPTYSATKAAVHSYTQSLRHQLDLQVIELVPPAVQTALLDQENDEHAMPLAEYVHETIQLLQDNPDAEEILVDRVKFLRNAEKESRYDQVIGVLNSVR
ncbi:SDR family oxidoreductase [Kribbella shirazensis]|uniref:Short-subunit dehydrogenase involved in D-alanine esterification of teichoic acids n=1 Tax=Kribbella shirazensis TaxID=1105143 RepID=A0A7X5V836_9ACTN|nr:SDR family NAD(P)-dependent oxidoreductase [Kribbella shirazensis]NIK56114.1 short-subunit dehydrogenase involved in D-alanine esterification of teichoic acids [Kribbella shirazensis]